MIWAEWRNNREWEAKMQGRIQNMSRYYFFQMISEMF